MVPVLEFEGGTLSRVVRYLLGILGTLMTVIVIPIVAFNIYLSTRPPGKEVVAAGIISIPAPFRIGRPFIDYMAVAGPRLYAGYASQGMVGVIDTGSNRVIATIGGLGRVHGVAIVANKNLGFATSSGDNNVNVFDLATNKLLTKISVADDPDAIIYAEKAQLIYVGGHDSKTATLIDPVTQKVVGTIALGGEPEYPRADPESGLIYQNLEDTSEVILIDLQKQAVIKRYKLGSGTGPTGLAVDATDRRIFSACRNQKLIVLNSDTGGIVAEMPIGSGVDGADYDPGLKQIYTANGLGSMTVIQQDSADKYRVLENAPTHFGGHSLVIDPANHRIYVAYFGSIAAYDPAR
jgi:DNA-binding beta-propeller fold protein YncE